MAWVKIPKENHALFMQVLPKKPPSVVKAMFGGLCAMVNGHMACGLFARTMLVRLPPAQLDEVLALDGAEIFDPMGRGAMKDTALLPEEMLGDKRELASWLQKALDHTATLPKKKPKPAASQKKRKTR